MAGAQSPSKRKGVAGASNAKVIPYRYRGGDHDNPPLDAMGRLARTVRPSDFRDTATYSNGIYGGILYKLAMKLPLEPWEQELVNGAKAAEAAQ